MEVILINSTLQASAGENILSFDAVPPNRFWKVCTVTAVNRTRNFFRLRFRVEHLHEQYGLLQYYFYQENSPTVNKLYVFSGLVYLGDNDFIEVSFSGCTAGDDLEVYLFGYEDELPGGAVI